MHVLYTPSEYVKYEIHEMHVMSYFCRNIYPFIAQISEIVLGGKFSHNDMIEDSFMISLREVESWLLV